MSESRGWARAGRIAAWCFVAVLALAVVALGWIGVRGALAYGHLTDARTAASDLTAHLDDPARVAAAIDSVGADAAAAHALTSDPVWRLAEGLPWAGPQLAAVGTVAAAADQVAGEALGPLVTAASSFSIDSLRPRDGAVELTTIAELGPAARTGADGVARATVSVDAIDAAELLPPLRQPIAEVRTLLHEVAAGADTLARASTLMPAMLGADGPRSYLVVFQNNAEWRSLGGIVGATALVATDGGRLSLAAQRSSGDFAQRPGGIAALPADIAQIYGTRPARYIQNATQVPEFPLAAQIARDMWAAETGTQVDGVLSLDPVALSYLLEATGPVPLPTGDVLTSENAVPLLLNEVYVRYERPADQDAFFQAAASAVFQAVSGGAVDPAALVGALARAGDEERLLLWSAREDEQAVLDGTTLQGALPVTDAAGTRFGVYLDDGTGAKMDYYLRADAATTWCAPDTGGDQAAVTVRLRSDAPADAASLPAYITGDSRFVPAGITRTVAFVYLPRGAELVTTRASGGGAPAGVGEVDGRRVIAWATDLAPGDEATLTVQVRTPRTPVLDTRLTPTVNPDETPGVAPSCEGAG